MEKLERIKQQDISRFKARAIETSLSIVESVENGETQVEQKEELENLHMKKILDHLPKDVDMIYIEEEKTICRDENLDNEVKPLIWGKKEIKKYTKKLKKGEIWR